jgi:mono/diheme cytochrome c family protein
MNKLNFGLLMVALFFLVGFSSCTQDNEEDMFGESECGDLSAVSLAADVRPVLQNACFSCHGTGAETAGIDLENYEKLSVVANNGQLLGAVKHLTGYASMPPAGEMLPECDIQKIEKWIEQGALNN